MGLVGVFYDLLVMVKRRIYHTSNTCQLRTPHDAFDSSTIKSRHGNAVRMKRSVCGADTVGKPYNMHCRSYGQEDEAFMYFLGVCPTLTRVRKQIINKSLIGDPRKSLLRFRAAQICCSLIRFAMENFVLLSGKVANEVDSGKPYLKKRRAPLIKQSHRLAEEGCENSRT